MPVLRPVAGAALGTALILLLSKIVPFSPDLSDWGGRAFPREYLGPLIAVAVIGYLGGWVGAMVSPGTGRLVGMIASIVSVAVIIGWGYSAPLLEPLFHHPAYPTFSDHALLATAVLLVSGHLGGLRVERRLSAKPLSGCDS